MEISVIVPAYNEQANIQEAMTRSLAALGSLFREFEIIIVDDRSTDSTGAMADALAARHPQIRVLHNPQNVGQGASIVNGFRAARGDLVTHNAMDYPFDLLDLRLIVPLMKDADVVVGARKSRPGYTLFRKLTSWVHRNLIRLLFGLNVHDYNFVQVYRKVVLDNVPFESHSTAFLTPEIVIRAHDLGYRIVEIPIDYHPRKIGVATSGSMKVILRSLRDMIKFWFRRRAARAAARAADGARRAP